MRIHMLGPYSPSKLGKVEAGSHQSLRIHLPKGAPGCQTQDTATSTSPTRPQASGWVATPRSSRTSVPATSIKRTLLSNPTRASQGRVLRPAHYRLLANSRWLLSEDDAPQWGVDEGRQPPTKICQAILRNLLESWAHRKVRRAAEWATLI